MGTRQTSWLARAVLVAMGFALIARPVAGQGRDVSLVSQIGGACRAVHVEGNYAYIGDGPNLQILDISNPSSPVGLGRFLFGDVVQDIFVTGGLAYVADRFSGLQIVDITNPSSPQLRGRYDTPGDAMEVYVTGGLAYVADVGSGLQIIDVTNPSAPTLRGWYDTPGEARGVTVSGGLAYVADGTSGGLQIIDVTNPSSPAFRGSYDTPGYAYGVYVAGGLAYVADRSSGLQIIDVTTPSLPTFRGSYNTPGDALDVYVTGGLAYVADGVAGGLQIINVANPAAPTLRGWYNTPGSAVGVFATAGLAYVADGESGLQIIDVTNPSSPQLGGWYETAGEAGDVFLSGTLAFVAAFGSGLCIIDVTNPSSPQLRGSYDTPGTAWGVCVSGGLAYVADRSSGVQIIDITDPSSPTLRGWYDTPHQAYGVYVTGDVAYVADGYSGLQIIDVTNPSSPTFLGSYDTPGLAQEVFVTGRRAYVADSESGSWVIDVTNPSSPTLRCRYDTPGRAQSIYVSGGLVYVADGTTGGLQIIDVWDPTSPTLRGWYDTPDDAWDVCITAGLAYVADSWSGLQIIDVTRPSSPQLFGSYYIPEGTRSVDVTGGLAFVASRSSGLWIFQYTGRAPRAETATISDVNNNGTIEAGDQLVLTLDRSVVVTTPVLQASHFFLPVQNDSLGGAGFAVGVNPHNSRQVVLTLGQGVTLSAANQFTTSALTPGSPSAIDFASSFPAGAIMSLDGILAVDGGVPRKDDTGIDVERSLVSHSDSVGTTGGTVRVGVSSDVAYTCHQLSIPAGVLAAPTTFTLLPPEENLGVINAVQIVSSDPAVTFAQPATISIEFREGDIDWERGLLASEMKVHQLVKDALGVFRYRVIPGTHTIESHFLHRSSGSAQEQVTTGGCVSVGVSNLNPCDSLGTIRVFAGLPIDTVDERTINIRPGGAGGIVGGEQALCTLRPGSDGAYTLHEIGFPGYAETSVSEPDRIVVTIRTALLAERVSQSGGQSFPAQSGAVFTVTTSNASGQPVAFGDTVTLTVQFKQRPIPTRTDVVQFDSSLGGMRGMALVRDELVGEEVDFRFVGGVTQQVNASPGTIVVRNLRGLTGPDGLGVYGAVAREGSLPASHWRLYR